MTLSNLTTTNLTGAAAGGGAGLEHRGQGVQERLHHRAAVPQVHQDVLGQRDQHVRDVGDHHHVRRGELGAQVVEVNVRVERDEPCSTTQIRK
jgi:hypothetical protein